MICDPADTCAGADIRVGWGGSVPVSLLTVNSELVFAKHSSGKRNRRRVFARVRPPAPLPCGAGDAEQMAGWERLGGTPDHTSFNHVRVCNHVMRILGCAGEDEPPSRLPGGGRDDRFGTRVGGG